MDSFASQAKALCSAASEGDVLTLAKLLDEGCDVNYRDVTTGDTLLLLAIESEQLEVIRVLLLRGADPNLAGPGGITPLQAAIDIAVEMANYRLDVLGETSRASTTTVSLLVQAGANAGQTNQRGESALDWARKRGHDDAYQLMNSPQSTQAGTND